MPDEIKKELEVKPEVEIKPELTVEETAAAEKKIEEEINEKLVENVKKIINPPPEDDKDKPKDKPKEDVKDNKSETGEVEDEPTDTKKDVKDDSDTTKTVDDKVAALNLPNRLMQAAKRNHLTSQDILDLGDKASSILGRFADSSDRLSAELGELGRKARLLAPKPKEDKKSTLEIKDNEDDSDEVKELKACLRALTSEVADLRNGNTVRERLLAEQEAKSRDAIVDGFFDKIAKDYPEFGNTKTLTKVQEVLRQSVWCEADDIHTGAKVNRNPISIEDALERAFFQYEGKNPAKKVSREKLLDEVKEREKQTIHRPSGRRTDAAGGDKGNEAAVAAVNKYLQKTGQRGWN